MSARSPSSSDPLLLDTAFSGNSAGSNPQATASALLLQGKANTPASSELRGCAFDGNTAAESGHVVYALNLEGSGGPSLTLKECTFTANTG